jgi:outer membrane immunogenic protein
MKKLLLTTAALVMTAGIAAAADMPLKAPLKAPPPVVLLWDNVYIGAEGGYGVSRQSWDQLAGPFALDRVNNSDSVKGGLAGGVIGFNRQLGSMVYGAEFTWDWSDIRGNQGHALNVVPNGSTTTHIDWISTLAGRIGFLANERTLIFAKGGLAVVDENFRINSAGVQVTNRPETTRRGFVVGAGVEYMFSSLSAKIEYNYMDFRNHDFQFQFTGPAGFAGLTENWRSNQQIHLVKVGLNWHFSPLPVIARY